MTLQGSVTGEMHDKNLRRHLFPTVRKFFPRGDGIFQEDNAPPHRAKIAAAAQEESRLQVLPWPVQSPDLSPIENRWQDVKRKLYSHAKKPKNLPELERAMKRAWKAIPMDCIQGLVDSMPQRIEACIAAKEGPNKY